MRLGGGSRDNLIRGTIYKRGYEGGKKLEIGGPISY